jgi:predicted transcriptional regulator
MDILYRLGRATAGDVMAQLSTDKTYSTIRSQLRTLEEKGHIRHEEHGLRYVYIPTAPRHAVRQSALKHLVDTFFGGSTEKVVTALIGTDASTLTDDELDRVASLIEKARKERK